MRLSDFPHLFILMRATRDGTRYIAIELFHAFSTRAVWHVQGSTRLSDPTLERSIRQEGGVGFAPVAEAISQAQEKKFLYQLRIHDKLAEKNKTANPSCCVI